jgi:hypothetical protein
MHTLEIPDKKIRLEYASCLEELTPEQARYFVHLYILYLNKDIDGETLRLWLAIRLLDIRSSVKYYRVMHSTGNAIPRERVTREQEWLDGVNGNLLAIADSLQSFFTEEVSREDAKPQSNREQLKYDCIKNLMPRMGKYYGPGDALMDCSFWEYKEAHGAFVQFAKTMDEKYLVKLAAILYRPKKLFYLIRKRLPHFNGQIRTAYTPKSNQFILEQRMKRMRKLSYAKLYYVFLFFKSCEEFLLHGRPEIDGKEINLSVLYEGASGGEDNIGLTGILFTLAETAVFGDIEKTADTGLYDVLSRLYQVTIQFKNLKKS